MSKQIPRRSALKIGAGVLTGISTTGAGSAHESERSQQPAVMDVDTKDSLDSVTYHQFDYVGGGGGGTSVYGEGGSSVRATPGYLQCSTNNEGVNFSRTTAETFTVPIHREPGVYKIRFDWRLNGTRTDGANVTARANLWKGEETARTNNEPVRTELLSNATRATPSYSTSGKAVLKTKLSETVGTVLSLELRVITTAQMMGAETGEFELYVPRPDVCDDEDEANQDGGNNTDDDDCKPPRRISVVPI